MNTYWKITTLVFNEIVDLHCKKLPVLRFYNRNEPRRIYQNQNIKGNYGPCYLFAASPIKTSVSDAIEDTLVKELKVKNDLS